MHREPAGGRNVAAWRTYWRPGLLSGVACELANVPNGAKWGSLRRVFHASGRLDRRCPGGGLRWTQRGVLEMAQVEMYSMKECSYCVDAKALLKEKDC